jgi:cytochrome c553
MNKSIIPILLSVAWPATAVLAEGSAENGRTLAQSCLGCHGAAGYFNVYPSYRVPKLGGQNAEYIEVALKAYKAGLRQHDTMHANAASLSDQDILDIAAYMASPGR